MLLVSMGGCFISLFSLFVLSKEFILFKSSAGKKGLFCCRKDIFLGFFVSFLLLEKVKIFAAEKLAKI